MIELDSEESTIIDAEALDGKDLIDDEEPAEYSFSQAESLGVSNFNKD